MNPYQLRVNGDDADRRPYQIVKVCPLRGERVVARYRDRTSALVQMERLNRPSINRNKMRKVP